MKRNYTLLFLLLFVALHIHAQQSILSYAGNSGKECFYDVLQLSDGTFLVSGYADNLNWIDISVPRTLITPTGVTNALTTTNRYAFIIQLSSDMQTILNVVHLPQGAAEDIMFIKTTNQPGQATGDMYISGTTQDSKANNGGYFIGRLNNNFVNGVPTAFAWVKPIWADAAAYFKARHAWDVTSNGKVYYLSGETHSFNWSAMYRLKSNGTADVVPKWTFHYKLAGGEYIGIGSSYPGGIDSLVSSLILFKKEKLVAVYDHGLLKIMQWYNLMATVVLKPESGLWIKCSLVLV